METDVYSHMSKEIISSFLHVHVFHWRKTLIDNEIQVLISKGKREHFCDFDVNYELIQHKAGLCVHVYYDSYLRNFDTVFWFSVFTKM